MVSLKNGRIQWPIQNGVDASIVINNEDGWDQFEEILMDFKYQIKIDYDPILRLTLESGLVIDENNLIITVTADQSKRWSGIKIFSDIKVKKDGKVLPVIPFDIIITNTVTDL